MRGDDQPQAAVFSYLSPEERALRFAVLWRKMM
jgi:hypothetical protein